MDTRASAVPAVGDPGAVVADFERRARRYETPCGKGVMAWRTWGEGPPLLLTHGAHGAWSHWIRNIDALAARYTVWAPDLPGYGESALPQRPDHADISEALAAGLRQLAPGPPLDILGFSLGGVVAAHLAALHPQLVRRVILVGTGGLATPMGVVESHRVRGLTGEARRAAHRGNLLAIMLHDPASVDELALHLQEVNSARGRLRPTPLVLPDRLLDVLPRVGAQVDAIWGEFDRPHPNPPVQEAALRSVRRELAFRVISGAGHWAMYERSEAFNRTALDLLQQPLRSI
ncbi:alpha/beta fold hydrolase [Phenylobacterium sp. LjRoot225]|uniref:alpha/beta fold hydrolase n=1 Tax=Phenylobacterium sp. LjRoot225 TaxID=3342285 RepID=UPI003ECE02D3